MPDQARMAVMDQVQVVVEERPAQHANVIWKQLLADYTPPPLDPAIDEALKEYVAKRKAEGGVPGYCGNFAQLAR